MTATADTLKGWVGASSTSDDVTRAFQAAVAVVSDIVGHSAVPAAILEEAILEVGASIYRRRAEPSGGGAISLTPDSPVPVRQPKDPADIARGLLRRWVEPAIS